MCAPATRVVVVLDAASPHSRSVIDALLRQNREERQRLRNAVAAHLIASYNAAPAPPPPASASAVGSPTSTGGATILSPTSAGPTNGGSTDGTGGGGGLGGACLPPLLSSSITWPGASAMSNVPVDHAHTHIVHVDCEGHVCHVGLNDPVCDRLKHMRQQSEEVLRRWKREREMEEEARAARVARGVGGADGNEGGDGDDDDSEEIEEELTPSPSSSAASTVRPGIIGSIDSALRLQAVAASSRRSNSDSSGSDVSGGPRRSITLLPPPGRGVGAPPRRSASSSSIAPRGSVGSCGEAVLTEEELELELERAVREAYVQPWIVRVVADGVEGDKLRAKGVRIVRDEAEALSGAWAVFTAFFDEKGLPMVKEDGGKRLLDMASKAGVQHLIVCSIIDLVPTTQPATTPASVLQTRALRCHAQRGSPMTVTLLSAALTFETALEQRFISIARGTSTTAPSSSPISAMHYVLHARFATHKYLPWSSSADVGAATVAILLSGASSGDNAADGAGAPQEVSLVSDLISAHEARAQCSQIVYVTNKRITTRESRGEAREMTREVRALIDYWIKYGDEVRQAVAVAKKETVRRGLRLTGWRELAFQRIDTLVPGWKDGVTSSSSSSSISRSSVAAAAAAAAALAATTPGGSPQPPDRYVTASTQRRPEGSPLGSEALSYVAGHQWSPRPASGFSTGSTTSTPASKTESRPLSSYFDGLHK